MWVYIEKQNQLAVCKLHPSHVWFFSACYDVVSILIKRRLKNGECVKFNLTATEVQRVGRYVLAKKEPMEPLQKLGIRSKKTNIGVSFVWVSLALVVVATQKYFISTELAIGYLNCATAVVIAHIIGHAITDGMCNFGICKKKKR